MSETDTITLESLVGEHWLTGVDVGAVSVQGPYHNEDAHRVAFRLDGVTYVATEDPDDGYRSMLKDLTFADAPPANAFPAVRVLAWMRLGRRGDDEVLELVAVENGKTVLAIGTENASDYYPYFVGDWTPENLPANDPKEGP